MWPSVFAGGYLRNLLVVLSASTLPPVWQRRAVVDGVARVLDGADGVAAVGARVAGTAVHRARPVLRRTHVVAGALVLEALGDAGADRLGDRRRAVGAELAGVGERRHPGAVADLVREPSTDAGDHPLVAEESVHAHRVGGEQRGEFVGGDRRPPPGRACRAAATSSAVGGRHAPHAGAALLALFGEQQGGLVDRCRRRVSTGSNVKRACPPRGFADRLVSGDETAALHQVHDERHRLEPQQQVLAPPADLEQRLAVGLGRGRDRRLQRREVERREAGEDAARELRRSAVRRAPGSRASPASAAAVAHS